MAGIGVAALGLVLSLWLAQHQAASMAQIEEARFTQETRAFSDALSQRIAGHTEVVNGLRGLFTANPRLSRLDFERAASEMEVGQRYPGVRNLSFTRWVPGPEREAYEARVRADTSLSPEGLPQFKIHPPGERPEYFVAEYLWPMFGNEGVLGLDISAQPINLAAMRYSRDSGQTVVSAPFDLLQESSHRAGIVIRVPVFDPTAGAAEQRFVGAVASTLRVYDLVQGLGSQGFLNGIAVSMDDLGPVRPNSGDNTVRPLLEQTAPGLPEARPWCVCWWCTTGAGSSPSTPPARSSLRLKPACPGWPGWLRRWCRCCWRPPWPCWCASARWRWCVPSCPTRRGARARSAFGRFSTRPRWGSRRWTRTRASSCASTSATPTSWATALRSWWA